MSFCDKCGHQNREDAKFCQGCGGKIIPITDSGSLGKGIILDGRYEIKRKIKSGGMGSVYEAVDRRFLDKSCAVKEMLTQSTNPADQQYMIKAFRKEAEILHDLRHPNLPIVKDYFIEHGRYYLVMDYIDGKDLETVIQGYFPVGVPEDKVLNWSKQILDALDYLHSQSPPVVYRDLKPANIMIKHSDGKIMLIDFGIARRVLPDSQTTKTSVGTPVFAAEELFYGKPVPASDIYSLGATMHCLLAGEMPVVPFSFKSLREINPDLSEELEDIVMKALSMAPKDRYISAKEMKKAIEEYEEKNGIKKVKEPVNKITEKDCQLKEDIEKYEVKIKESKPQAAPPQITAIPPAPSKVKNKKKVIFAFLSVLLIICVFSLWKFYFNSPERFINMAKEELSKKHIPETIKLCNKALLLKSDNKEAHRLLLEAYLAQEDAGHAGEELEVLLKLGEGTSENYLKWGEGFYSLKDYFSSARCFEQVLKNDGKNMELLVRTARCYELAGKKEEALKKYTELGNIYLKKKEFQKAEDFFKSILKLDKDNIQAKEGLALCHWENNKYQDAVKLLNSLPDNEKNRKEIKEIFLECYLKMGQEYMDNENIDGALKEYKKAFMVDKNNISIKKDLARCYLIKARSFIKEGNIKNAKDMCKNVKTLFTKGEFSIQLNAIEKEISEKEIKKVSPTPIPSYNPPSYNPPVSDGGGENPDVIGP
jgi:serine/threonine protein kinase